MPVAYLHQKHSRKRPAGGSGKRVPDRPHLIIERALTPGRFRIGFEQYARIDIPNVWRKLANPVRYGSLEKLQVDIGSIRLQRRDPGDAAVDQVPKGRPPASTPGAAAEEAKRLVTTHSRYL